MAGAKVKRERPKGNRAPRPSDDAVREASRRALAKLRQDHPRSSRLHNDIVNDAHTHCLQSLDPERGPYEAFVPWKASRLAIDRLRREQRERLDGDVDAPEAREASSEDDRTAPKRKRRPPGAVSALGDPIAAFLNDSEHNSLWTLVSPLSSAHLLGVWVRAEIARLQGELPQDPIRLTVPNDFDQRLWQYVERYARMKPGTWIEGDGPPPARRGKQPKRDPYIPPGYQWELERRAVSRAVAQEALRLCGLPGATVRALLGAERKRNADERRRRIERMWSDPQVAAILRELMGTSKKQPR